MSGPADEEKAKKDEQSLSKQFSTMLGWIVNVIATGSRLPQVRKFRYYLDCSDCIRFRGAATLKFHRSVS
jgi:uncharacterized protein YfaT (DUF1175 family)